MLLLLSEFAYRIHTTRGPPLSRALYIILILVGSEFAQFYLFSLFAPLALDTFHVHPWICKLAGYGRLPEMSAGKMTIENWSRKEALCNDLLRVFELTEGAQAIVKGEG